MAEDGKKKEDVLRQKRQCKSDSKALTYVLSNTIKHYEYWIIVTEDENKWKEIGYA